MNPSRRIAIVLSLFITVIAPALLANEALDTEVKGGVDKDKKPQSTEHPHDEGLLPCLFRTLRNHLSAELWQPISPKERARFSGPPIFFVPG